LILGLPALAAVVLVDSSRGSGWTWLATVAAPTLFLLCYIATAGLLARLTVSAIVPGKFKRDLGDPVYGRRRLYGLCWTAVYYFAPLYNAILAVPILKWFTLRLFGYRGALDVTLYPDTWIRDLPLLDICKGAYLSNKATIGTNMCLFDGNILVGRVRIGRRSMVGHLTMLAPGVVLGNDVEVGVGAAIGMDTRVGDRSLIGPCSVIHHRVTIGARCHIGCASHIGAKSVIHDGIAIPFGTVLPPRTVIRSSDDLGQYRRPAALIPSLIP
jgi:bifunctional N-acetylglucosamine-1-phosphate-uridyltransferase/glucosamine-1-phosphate-acetyltransferase GlmU-like protein